MVNCRPAPSLTRAKPCPVHVTIWPGCLSLCTMLTLGWKQTHIHIKSDTTVKCKYSSWWMQRCSYLKGNSPFVATVGYVSVLPSAAGRCDGGGGVFSADCWDAAHSRSQPEASGCPKQQAHNLYCAHLNIQDNIYLYWITWIGEYDYSMSRMAYHHILILIC